jgi:nickel-type superoxide dismutase maturation protease
VPFPWFRLAVNGLSMVPTLAPGEWVVVRRTRPREGAVVVVRRPERLVVKRAVRRTDGGWWVEGDNAAASDDSRVFGPVDDGDVLGEVRWRYRPFRSAGRVR